MAVLTDAEYAVIRKNARTDQDAYECYIREGLTKQEWKAGIQALEDWFESSRADQKAAMDAGIGKVVSNVFAKKTGRIFYQWKWREE